MKNPFTKDRVWWGAGGVALGLFASFVFPMNASLESTVQKRVTEASQTAVADAMAPSCADKFLASGQENIDKYNKESQWRRGDFLETGKFASNRTIANKCVGLVDEKMKKMAAAPKQG